MAIGPIDTRFRGLLPSLKGTWGVSTEGLMASKKTSATKRSRRASQPTTSVVRKPPRRRREPRPVTKAELPEPIATFVF